MAEVKFEKEEIDKIRKFKGEYEEVTARLGEAEVEMLLIETQRTQVENYKTSLKEKYLKLRTDEVALANELKDKYGEGEFDINSGIFHPKA